MDRTLLPEQVQTINGLIVRTMGVTINQVTPDARFMEDLAADSLSIVELSMAVEDEFGIIIPDQEMERCVTVEILYATVAGLLGRG